MDSKQLTSEVEEIKKRNRRVEADKAWETSWTRRVIIIVLTYFVIVIFFFFAGLPDPLVNSIVPALAFAISTFSLPLIKKYWIRNLYKKR